MRRFVTVLISLVPILLAGSLAADDVFLKNGRVFEDVETRVDGSKVLVYLSFGEIGFSLDAVERIEPGTSSHAVYRERRDALRTAPGTSAADWLELARWSDSRGLEHATREAALTAARLDPDLPGLDALLGQLDFVVDPESGRWIEREEALRRAGYRWVDGRWLSVEQQLARAETARAAAEARAANEERRLTRAVLALAAAQLAETSRQEEQPRSEPVYAWPVGVYPNPFLWRHPNPHRMPPPGHDPTAIPMERRQPGSLFPIESRGRIGAPARGAVSGSASSGSR